MRGTCGPPPSVPVRDDGCAPQALTRWRGPRSWSGSCDPRTHLPSRGTTWPAVRTKVLDPPPRNPSANGSASRCAMTRPKVACDGIPWGRARKVRNQVSCRRPKRAMTTKWSAPQMTARTAITRISVNGCHWVRSTRGSSNCDKVSHKGEAIITSMMGVPQLVSRPSHCILVSTNPI